VHRPLILDIAGIQGRGRLKQDDPAFFLGHWTMLDSARHYDELAFFDPFMPVEEIHAETALDHQEHFVFALMMVKYKLAIHFDELDLLVVEFGGNAGLIVFGDLGELVSDIDFGHDVLDLLCLIHFVRVGSKNKSRQLTLAAECRLPMTL
jgi:hypothetical protein